MNGAGRIEQLATRLPRMALRADGGAELGRREVGQAERPGDRWITHQIVLGIAGAGAVAGLAADLDGDVRSGRSLSGAVTSEALGFGFGGKSLRGGGVRRQLPRRELRGMAGAARRAPGPVAAGAARE